MTRRPFVCANWKMHRRPSEAPAFVEALRAELGDGAAPDAAVEVAIAPPHPTLDRLGDALRGTGVGLAAQNVHPEAEGAFTGEVSVAMLEDLGCRYALAGHSERRQLFGETDAFVAAKVVALLGTTVRPILCLGETLEEREAGRTEAILARQLGAALDAIVAGAARERADELVVAYEPVWAIGTGRTATPEIAQAAHATLRSGLRDHLGEPADAIRILYGGSVKPSNAGELLSQPDIDGALVGGASLEPDSFAAIVHAARP